MKNEAKILERAGDMRRMNSNYRTKLNKFNYNKYTRYLLILIIINNGKDRKNSYVFNNSGKRRVMYKRSFASLRKMFKMSKLCRNNCQKTCWNIKNLQREMAFYPIHFDFSTSMPFNKINEKTFTNQKSIHKQFTMHHPSLANRDM